MSFFDRQPNHIISFEEANSRDVDLLGDKGANLCATFQLGLPVPPGFIITTEACSNYRQNKNILDSIIHSCEKYIYDMEKKCNKSLNNFHSNKSPLLLAVRCSPVMTLTGLMDTVLNIGMNDNVVEQLSQNNGRYEKFALDLYRRFLQNFGVIVMDVDNSKYEKILGHARERDGVQHDHELSIETLSFVIVEFKHVIAIPDDGLSQLRLAIAAMFRSWKSDDSESPSARPGLAIIIQEMVHGNRNSQSGSGICFLRKKELFGEYLKRGVGEEVSSTSEEDRVITIEDMGTIYPELYAELYDYMLCICEYFDPDIQYAEFTVDNGKIYILETNNVNDSKTYLLYNSTSKMQKRCYEYHHGSANDIPILGVKAANICEMSNMGLTVPHGFILPTSACDDFIENDCKDLSKFCRHAIDSGIRELEIKTGKLFGKEAKHYDPLIVAVRISAPVKMNGLLHSVLCLGLNDDIVEHIGSVSSFRYNFALHIYITFLYSFGVSVLNVSPSCYQELFDEITKIEQVSSIDELHNTTLKNYVIPKMKALGHPPDDPYKQLKMTIEAFYKYWNSDRCQNVRTKNKISSIPGIAIIVQEMIYGNLNGKSGIGICCIRDCSASNLIGSFLTRGFAETLTKNKASTSITIEGISRYYPKLFHELKNAMFDIHAHFDNKLQYVEFVIQDNKLYFLETHELESDITDDDTFILSLQADNANRK